MINSLNKILRKNTEILALFILILISVISTSYFNYNKNKTINSYVESFNAGQKIMMNIWQPIWEDWVGEFDPSILP